MWSINVHPIPKRMRTPICLLLVGGLFLTTGCSGIKRLTTGLTGGKGDGYNVSATSKTIAPLFGDVLDASYTAADALSENMVTKTGRSNGAILAASFVNINNLEETSPLGRMIAEQIASRMAQNGFRMLEVKLRQNSIYIKEGEGEFMLSRQLQEISSSHNGDLVIVGTYAVAEKSIYISARIVDAADSTILTGYDCQLDRNYQTDSLLEDMVD